MKVGGLTRVERETAEGDVESPEVRVFPTKAAAKDAMIADFGKIKEERYPSEDSIFDESCDEDEACIVGTDDSVVQWCVSEPEVEP